MNVDREPSANVVFGAGIHQCQGAPLARLEMRVAIEELLARTSGIAAASLESPERVVYPSNGLAALTVRFS